MLELILVFCIICLSLSFACSLGDRVTCRVVGTYVVLVQQGAKARCRRRSCDATKTMRCRVPRDAVQPCETALQKQLKPSDLGGYEYTSWSRYRAFYSTPDADRDYLQFWETIVKEIKWLEQYMLTNESSIEWARVHSKATFQACRIASGFQNMTLELAAVGLHEYIWDARINLMFMKDRDGIFYEIWRRVNDNHLLSFRDALEQVYGENLYSAHDRSMKYELNYGDSNMERVFARCTKGISDSVPEYKARELIAQEIHWTSLSSGTYARYARKKLKVAELIGLIPKDKIGAV
ncbi:uncharacterized protein [Triticum aestivum]|uniref:uncharacterized protein n=1 Tax=Triticum aestivum TaxID=4565 RepID=UPI001D00369B|nr:uncharacterized protein LOC123084638 [Triticum aestivum]